MDGVRFDTLSRSLTLAGSRRGTLAAVLSGTLGLLGLAHPEDAGAAKSGKCKRKCDECAPCKKGTCQQKNGKKVCKKGKCKAKDDGTDCSVGTCQGGTCVSPPPCGTGGTSCVFITSTTHQGNFGGLTAGDAICQQRAQAAGLPGTYKAWLSDDTNSPNTRFVKSPGPYHLPDGTKVADSYADLTDSSLDAVIDRTESGQAVSSPFECWTFTDADGSDFGGTDHCSNWTSTSGQGHYGRAVITTHNWTNWNSVACSAANRLYCFQQS